MYEGALEKQGKTLGAMMGTVKDQLGIFMADFGDMLRPLFEKGLIYLQKFVDKVPQLFASVQPVVMAAGDAFFWLIDALVSVGSFLGGLYDKIRNGNPLLIALATVIAGVVSYMILMQTWTMLATAATTLWTGAQWALNAAMTANPIGVIIAFIVALGAAIAFIIYRLDGWGVMWEKTTTGMKMMWSGFVGSFQLQWYVAEDFILRGIENLKKAWYSLKSLWDADGAQQALNGIAAQQKARQDNIINKAREVKDNMVGGAKTWYAGMNSLSWNNKSFGDMKNDTKKLFGIDDAKLPGQTKVTTSFGGGDSKGSGRAKSGGKSSESVATGGQKNVTVNITYGNAVGTFNLTAATMGESVENIKDLIIDTITRGVAQGASLGAV